MEVLIRRRCCMWCNTEAATPPLALATRGGQPLRKCLTLVSCIFIKCLGHAMALITDSCLLACFNVGSGSSVDHTCGGVGGVQASLPTKLESVVASPF